MNFGLASNPIRTAVVLSVIRWALELLLMENE